VPGIPLGSDTNTIVGTLGQPLKRTTVVNDPALGFLEEWSYPDMAVSWYGALDTCSSILLFTPTRATARGIRVGDPVARVRRLYGEPFHRRAHPDSLYLQYELHDRHGGYGLVFLLTQDTVRTIRVGRYAFVFK
jgi:hypothetical protein